MRDITSGFQSAIEADALRPFSLLELFFDSQTVRLWTGNGTLTWNGNTYTGTGTQLSSTPLSETADLKAAGRQYNLEGVSSSLISLAMTEDYQERPVYEYLGAMDDDGNVVVDPYRLWHGRMDVMTPIDDGQTATISLACESILIDLESEDERVWSDSDQQLDWPGDKFFQHVSETEAKITWGAPS